MAVRALGKKRDDQVFQCDDTNFEMRQFCSRERLNTISSVPGTRTLLGPVGSRAALIVPTRQRSLALAPIIIFAGINWHVFYSG